MASLIDDLNALLVKTRSCLEAARAVADETEESDPDISVGLEDIIEGERWSSSGLYHRITRLNGTPSILSSDSLQSKVEDTKDLSAKIGIIGGEQRSIANQTRALLRRDDLDEPTKELLQEMYALHLKNSLWCKEKMREWIPG